MSQTPTQDIRRRLLAGEPLLSRQTADDYGCSRSLLGQVVTVLESEGAVIDREMPAVPDPADHGSTRVFRLVKPTPDPTARSSWGKGRGVRKLGNRGGKGTARAVANANGTAPVVRAAVNGKGVGTAHPVPVLGESVQVFLLALTDDGRVNVGLRDGEQTWLTTVDGFSTR